MKGTPTSVGGQHFLATIWQQLAGGRAQPRCWEIDCLRGLAVALMVVSNFLFDLVFFAGQVQLRSGVLDGFARFIAGFFIVLAGVSLTLSHARPAARAAGFGKYLRRGLQLLVLGGVITIATWVAAGDQMVRFGVLHLIGSGVILAYPFLTRPWLSLGAGLLLLAASFITAPLHVAFPWLLWLGVKPYDFSSVDYAPLIPWFGFMLLGVFLGHQLYPGGQARWQLADFYRFRLCRGLVWCGRHSLAIYFGHQPLLLAGIALTRRWW